MSDTYGTYPKAVFSWNNSQLNYVYVSYYGNTTATASTITSSKQTGTTFTSRDLSLNTLYTFTITPYNGSDEAGYTKTITLDTTPKSTGVYSASVTTASSTQIQWYGTYQYVKVSRATAVGTSGTLGSYVDISDIVLSMPYYDKDLSGNTKYSYYITPYYNGYNTASSAISVYTNVQAAKDLSYTFLDSSAVTISFTAPKNSYTSSVSYTLTVYNLTLGYTQTATGTSSPLFVQNLSSGTDHKCYIITKLDNDTSLISTSDAKTITTDSVSTYVTAIPISNNTFTSNSLTVSSFSGTNSFQNGTYDISYSSTYNAPYLSYYSFNSSNTQGWLTSGSDNYSTSSPYAYIGTVGSKTTLLNGTTINGAWIQIKLPYSLLLTSYSLTQQVDWEFNNVYLLASNTSVNDWVQLNYTYGDTTVSTTYTYSVTTSTYYKYYRFAITNAADGGQLVGFRYIKLMGYGKA
jgi:hypothetical protein